MLKPIKSQKQVNVMKSAAANLLGLRISKVVEAMSARVKITEKICSDVVGFGHAKNPDNGPRTVVRKN